MVVYVGMVDVGNGFYPYGVFGTKEKAKQAISKFPKFFVWPTMINKPIDRPGV